MTSRVFVPLLFALLVLNFPLLSPQIHGADNWSFQILESDAHHLLVELTLPSFDKETVSHNEVLYQRLSVDQWPAWGRPGQPQLPMYSVPVGLPRPGQPQLSIVEAETEVLGPHQVYPVPRLARGMALKLSSFLPSMRILTPPMRPFRVC